ncbi:hypothetical protein L916_04254, partial [Phytophthora nicotianae]
NVLLTARSTTNLVDSLGNMYQANGSKESIRDSVEKASN